MNIGKISKLLLLLVISTNIVFTYANTKLDYYTSVILGWGLRAQTMNNVVPLDDTVYSTVMSSDLSKPTLQKYVGKKLIVICDKEIDIDSIGYCDNHTVKSDYNEVQIKDLKIISYGDFENKQIFVPEYYLINPKNAINVGEYINALYKSSNSFTKVQKETEESKTLPIKELAYITIIICGVIGLLSIVNHRQLVFTRLKRIDTHKLLQYFIVIVGPIIFLALFKVFSLGLGNKIDKLPIITLVITATCLTHEILIIVYIFIKEKYYQEITLNNEVFKKVNEKYFGFVLSILYMSSLLTYIFLSTRTAFIFLLINIIYITGIYLVNPKTFNRFSSTLLVSILVTTIPLTFGLKYLYTKYTYKPVSYKNIFQTDILQVLPKKINIDPNDRFSKYSNDVKVNLYADGYPILLQKYNQYKILPFNTTLPINGLIVLPTDIDRYLKFLKNYNNRNIFVVPGHSQIFSVINSNPDTESTLTLKFKCNQGLQADTIYINRYDADSENVNKSILINFPGCDNNSESQYVIPYKFFNDHIYYIYGSNINGYESMDFSIVNGLITYYKNPTKFDRLLFMGNPNNSDILNVYMINTVRAKGLEKVIFTSDFTENLNKLIENKLINDSFTIWSDSNNAILNNTL